MKFLSPTELKAAKDSTTAETRRKLNPSHQVSFQGNGWDTGRYIVLIFLMQLRKHFKVQRQISSVKRVLINTGVSQALQEVPLSGGTQPREVMTMRRQLPGFLLVVIGSSCLCSHICDFNQGNASATENREI